MVRALVRGAGCGSLWAASDAPGDKGEAEGTTEARLGPSRRSCTSEPLTLQAGRQCQPAASPYTPREVHRIAAATLPCPQLRFDSARPKNLPGQMSLSLGFHFSCQ